MKIGKFYCANKFHKRMCNDIILLLIRRVKNIFNLNLATVTPVSVEYCRTQLSDEVTHRIAARTVSDRDHETMTHVPRDTHVTKQIMAMRSNFPWSDFKKLGTPELSSSSSTGTALSPKNAP